MTSVMQKRFAPPIWFEPVVATSIGVVIEVVNGVFFRVAGGWLLGIAVAVGGLLLAVQRHAIQGSVGTGVDRVRGDVEVVRDRLFVLSEYIDLSRRTDYDSLLAGVVDRYSSITELEFEPVKRQVIEEASETLRRLASTKRSATLQTADYYDWLFKQFNHVANGEYVHAVSLSSEEEWNDSDLERNFLRVNIEAAERGVEVARIFVVKANRLQDFVKLPPIVHHAAESNVPLRGFLVRQEELEKFDPNLLRQIDEGFIDFNGRVGLEDRFDPSGGARGEVTMLPQDLKQMKNWYAKLMNLAVPLSTQAVQQLADPNVGQNP